MRQSAPIARWRNSHGALTQSWFTPAGRPQPRMLTQEFPAIRAPRPNQFALVLAFGFLIPGGMALVPLMAAAVLIIAALGKPQIEKILGSRTGFATVSIACALAGSTLGWGAPYHHWLADGLAGALWGIAVAAASWRYDLVAA